jgi:FlaG/FlaF family flagellin (archaellin)
MTFGRGIAAVLAAALVLGQAVPAEALDRRVRIVNETGFTIVRFYGSNTGTDDWQEDILGDDVLPSGSSVTINFDDGTGYCKYDLRAIFDDGDEVTQTGVNICEVGTLTFN